MVLIAGWGEGNKILGKSKPIRCNNCNNENPFYIVEQSKKITAFFIPVAKWGKKYYLLCPICKQGPELRNLVAAMKMIATTYIP